MIDQKEQPINNLSIPYKKGVNAEELINLRLAEKLEFPKKDYYYEYTVNADCLEVKYSESQRQCMLLKAQKKQKTLLADYKKYVLYLLFIGCLNYAVLQQNLRLVKINQNQRVKSTNKLYVNQQKISRVKNLRSANELYLSFLSRIMALPLGIQKLEVISGNYDISGYVGQDEYENFTKKIDDYGWRNNLNSYSTGPFIFISLKGSL